jgi:pilus assembly protein Flp/PilA
MRKSWNGYSRLQGLMLHEEGQDLVEYALVVALIAFASTAAMQAIAGNVSTVFTSVGSILTSATS